jgi:hypothetical protein
MNATPEDRPRSRKTELAQGASGSDLVSSFGASGRVAPGIMHPVTASNGGDPGGNSSRYRTEQISQRHTDQLDPDGGKDSCKRICV